MIAFSDYKNLLTDLMQQYHHRADFLSIRLEKSDGTSILLRGDQIETLSEGIALGGQIRACYKGGWGFASFNQLSTLTERIEEAITAARLIGEEETLLAPVDPVEMTCQLPLTGTDPREIPLKDKKALCDRYNTLLRTYNNQITTTTIRYGDSTQQMLLVTSEGTILEQSWSDLEMRFSATARNGDIVQTGRETTGSRQGYEDLLNLDPQVRGAAERSFPNLTNFALKLCLQR
jgi:TldD protein